MAPVLTTPDGAVAEPAAPAPAPVDPDQVNRDFSRAMATDSPDAAQPPPRRDAPPADGEPPRRPRGRPRKNPDEQPRAAEPVPAESQKSDKDFTEQCTGIAMIGWAAVAAVPVTTPYAVVIDANLDQLVPALNAGCQQNAKVRAAVERWSSGAGGIWMLQLAAVGTNMAMHTLQLMQDAELRGEARKATQGKLRDYLKAQGLKLPDDKPAEAPGEPAPA